MKASLVLVLVLCSLAAPAAAVPIFLSHHGRLLDTSDVGVEGEQRITFRLYPAHTQGQTDTALWEQEYTVHVAKGVYAVLIGDPEKGKSLDDATIDFTKPLFLAVQVKDFPELAPRLAIGASVYALAARNSEKFGGKEPAFYATAQDLLDSKAAAEAKYAAKSELAGVAKLDGPAFTGNVTFSGNATISGTAGVSGKGTGLTALDAAQITVGKIQDAQLVSGDALVKLTGAQTIAGAKTFGELATFGAGLTAGGPTTFSAGLTAGGNIVASTGAKFIGDGSALTNLPTGGINAPLLRFHPPTLQVPATGTASATVTNIGSIATDALTIGATPGFRVDSNNCPSTGLAANGTCTLILSLDPALAPGFRVGAASARSAANAGAEVLLWGTWVASPDGSANSAAAPTCAAIKTSYPSKGDGVYWIDPDGGSGAIAPFQTWCDMTTAGGPWTLIFSSNAVDGTNMETGAVSPSTFMQTLAPNGQMIGLYTGFSTVSGLRFACDQNRDQIKDVDFFYSDAAQANALYLMFKASTSDASFAGTSNAATFRSKSYTDVISGQTGTTSSGVSWEESDGDTGDFFIASGGSGNQVCYNGSSATPVVTNCMGAHDGRNNMCQRLQPAGSGVYATTYSGYWYVFIK